MMSINKVSAGSAFDWYKQGWAIFKKDLLHWVIMAALVMLGLMVASFIPLLGIVLVYLLIPLVQAGMMQVASVSQQSDYVGSISFKDLANIFQQEKQRNALIVLGSLMLLTIFALALAVGILMMPFLDSDQVQQASGNNAELLAAMGLPGLFLLLTVTVVYLMLFTYSPALVAFDKMAPWEAMKKSFQGAAANLNAFLVFLLVYAVLGGITLVTLGIASLVVLPVVLIATYCSYKDIFKAKEVSNVTSLSDWN